MASRHCISLFIALAVAAAGTPGVFAAPATDRATYKGSHAPERPDEPAAAFQASAQLDAQIAHLRAIRERLSRASSDDERRMLLAERDTVMRDAMATMHGSARARTAGLAGKPGAGPGMCYDATQQHVALMQEMMLAMPDGHGAGMPNGAGSGPGMHRGMMAQ